MGNDFYSRRMYADARIARIADWDINDINIPVVNYINDNFVIYLFIFC